MSRAGVRILGELVPVEGLETDGISQSDIDETDPSHAVYEVTGVATDVRGIEINTGRGSEPAGTEFVLATEALRLQVQVERTVAIESGSRVRVAGRMVVIGDYEWDAFELTDTRAAWRIRRVVPRSDGDLMLDLAPARS